MIFLFIDNVLIARIFTTLDKQTLVDNWYVIKRMANCEDLQVLGDISK